MLASSICCPNNPPVAASGKKFQIRNRKRRIFTLISFRPELHLLFFLLNQRTEGFWFINSFMADKPINSNIQSLISFVVFSKIYINLFPQAAFGKISHTKT